MGKKTRVKLIRSKHGVKSSGGPLLKTLLAEHTHKNTKWKTNMFISGHVQEGPEEGPLLQCIGERGGCYKTEKM